MYIEVKGKGFHVDSKMDDKGVISIEKVTTLNPEIDKRNKEIPYHIDVTFNPEERRGF